MRWLVSVLFSRQTLRALWHSLVNIQRRLWPHRLRRRLVPHASTPGPARNHDLKRHPTYSKPVLSRPEAAPDKEEKRSDSSIFPFPPRPIIQGYLLEQ